ncbi:MAG: glycerate kinase type-2 family protein [Candidatus Hodarchaeales archaeon]
MEIKNYKDLLDLPFGSSEICAREFLLRLLKIGLDAVNPFEIVTRNLQYNSVSKLLMVSNSEFDLTDKQVRVIGAGKAVGRMAEAIEKVLQGVPLSGIICVPEGVRNSLTLKKIQCVESSHPLPSEINLENTERTIEYIKELTKDDLVISLISGGGSALWSAPIPPITITDLISLNQTLLHSGMSIHEINVVRKHMSRIKGGKAARMIPSTTLILLLSDVIGDQLESIASGPFSPDTSTYHDVINLFRKYNLSKDVLPTSIYEVVTRGLNGEIAETPKPKDPSFSRFHHSIIGSNNVARQAIYKAANQVGMEVIVEDHLVDGDARIVGTNLAQIGLQISKEKSTPVLYISGGEPIVKVTGNGIGGRNQEVVAAFLREVSTFDPSLDISLISFGTDGIDGNSEYAGAICDTFTLNLFREKKVPIDCYQENNDLTNFFLQLGKSLILLGPTGTNVMDVQLLLVNSADMEQNSPLQ